MDSLPRTGGRYSEFEWGRELPPFPNQCSTPDRLHVEAQSTGKPPPAQPRSGHSGFFSQPQGNTSTKWASGEKCVAGLSVVIPKGKDFA